ncbi:aldehyde dehydrogenase family protein [Carbonactinospora thermoautotrophica]|uniref:aldehyde dehydrogenase family protein n=1 Tax=Carbonactinospora thermoautotrophica TaxID=1469144 RepID=UPI002270CDCD|nr:aldehyde dehydrogenase family protein [Carbonactinospora thermoautotrophica]
MSPLQAGAGVYDATETEGCMEQTYVRIGGVPTTTDRWDEVLNPHDGQAVARVPSCGTQEVEAACEHALKVLRRDDFPQYARAEVLERTITLLDSRREEFARTITLESAKPIRDARDEVDRAIETFRFTAAEARRLVGEMVPMDASRVGVGRLGFALRVPAGVVAAVTPFDFPLNLVVHKLAPAIAAGCPVVLKPAEETPLSAIRLVDLLVEAGLPADWVSVVTGGAEVGQTLVRHPVPRVVSFTGGAEIGHAIRRAAPEKKVLLELGSNAPVIIEPDADLADVARRVRQAAYAFAGQSRISTRRVLVHRDVHQEFLALLADAVADLVVGDPFDEATDVGPLIRASETERVLAWVQEAVAGGGHLVAGGEVRDGILLPTVVDEPPPAARLVREEVFGPVVTVQAYGTFDEAVALANDSPYALHVGVFTRDLGIALRAIRELEFGGVLVNEVPTFRADQEPYGGLRHGGNTREGPAYSIQEMTELRFGLICP